MHATQQILAALAYVKFQSNDIEASFKSLINKMDADLDEVSYETSLEVDTAIEELASAINEVDQNVEAITDVDVEDVDEEEYEEEVPSKEKRSNADRDI